MSENVAQNTEEIVEEAVEVVEEKKETKKAVKKDVVMLTPEEAAEQKVKVELFKDNENYKDDVFVAVNFEAVQIQRGKPVEIKRCYAEVLENSKRADNAAADRVAKLEAESLEKLKNL